MLTGVIKAFMSYSHRDSEFVSQLALSLEHYGVEVWQDKQQIRVGEKFDARIYNAIEASDIFVVVFSPATLKSVWVQKEIERALKLNRQRGTPRIFPVLIENCELPASLKEINFADFRNTFEKPFSALISSIRLMDTDQEPYKSPFVASPPYRDTSQNEAIRYYNLGRMSYQRGDIEEGMKYFAKAMELDPRNLDALYNLAVTTYDLAKRKDDENLFQLAVERYERILMIRPDDVDALVNLGVIYNTRLSFGKPDRAKELFERAIKIAPKYALAWLNLALYYCLVIGREIDDATNSGRTITIEGSYLQIALKCYEQAFKLDPSLKESFQGGMEGVKTLLQMAESRSQQGH